MFAYCRNNPVKRIDITGTADLCVTTNENDNDPLNDYGPVRGSTTGVSGNSSDSGYGGGRASSGDSYGGTVIYRWNCTNAKNLMPSNKDVRNNSPLSFSTQYRAGSAMTTIESINGTGILRAVQDGDNHVSVSPLFGTIQEWRAQGINSIWTRALMEIVKFIS